ncbi:hypothetical protein LPJ61_004162 [Coemansia biformis]|uniref:Anaphase-promoting complex subunit 4-like WD40 domain-containing protein n=1 Tax=Coemansia biformis TaxID=1286918 RepID=A0A9W7YBL3_9FUNG|nr:hypothetical protein LPJ61_004162 [Coemansia biformis]
MVLKSEDVNYLVYRYLKESGFLHSSYIFQFESQIYRDDPEQPNVEPGSLIRVLQKGLQYMDVETHLNEDGTARLCTAPFSLVGKHVCSVQPSESSSSSSSGGVRVAAKKSNNGVGSRPTETSPVHGGHTLVHDTITTLTTTPTPAAAAAAATPTLTAALKEAKKSARAREAGTLAVGDAAMVVDAPPVGGGGDADEDDDDGGDDGSMDVDVPDAEKENQKATPEAKAGRKGRTVETAQLLRGHTSPVFLCAWNPTSANILATGAGDGTARIWDLSSLGSGERAIVLSHDAEEGESRVDVTSIVWNTQGTLLATACFNGQLRVWTAAGELKLALRQRQAPIIAMRWNRDGTSLLSAYLDGSIALWDMQTGQKKHEYRAHSGCVLDVDWLDNVTFASCGNDRAIKVWRDGDTAAPVKTFTGHKSDINAIRWHAGGKYLASASDDGTVKVWSMASDQPVQDFIGHSQQVYLVKWVPRPDKAVLASASFDGTVRVWDVHSSSCLRVLSAHSKAVDCLAFSADGRHLATGSFDRKVCIWRVKDGSLVRTYLADDSVHDVQWAAKGRVAVAVASSTVALFDPLPV